MPVRITEIRGPRGFFRIGDKIISVDGRPVEDQLDLYYQLSGEESVVLTIRRTHGLTTERRLRTETIENAGLVFERMKFRTCTSKCIFCFVDQMPPRLRGTLYCKDDDYRLSFLYGNYVTLNDIGTTEIQRIIETRMSPLYVSVHATEPSVRRRLFGRPLRRSIIQTLSRLVEAGIVIHAQVVLIPGLNDGTVLDRTIDDLGRLFPGIRTLAIVPVGLTRHRRGLEPIRPITRSEARELIDHVEAKSATDVRRIGSTPFLHCSDEFYLRARRTFPPAEAYGDFEQISNGVGMCRAFTDRVTRRARILSLRRTAVSGRLTLVTGRLGAAFLRKHVLPEVNRHLPGLRLDLLVVRNRLFGDTVGVTGLLAGRDIVTAARARAVHGCLVLPPNSVNCDGLMIDDMRPSQIGRQIGALIILPQNDFLENAVIRSCERRSARI